MHCSISPEIHHQGYLFVLLSVDLPYSIALRWEVASFSCIICPIILHFRLDHRKSVRLGTVYQACCGWNGDDLYWVVEFWNRVISCRYLDKCFKQQKVIPGLSSGNSGNFKSVQYIAFEFVLKILNLCYEIHYWLRAMSKQNWQQAKPVLSRCYFVSGHPVLSEFLPKEVNFSSLVHLK